jgi:hypothetical protein
MNIKTKLIPITYLAGMEHGYANGYVGVPKEHPWYGKHYDEIESSYDISVHGGLTFAGKLKEDSEDYWYVGFDTAHYRDNSHNCDKTYCENEVQSLKEQAEKIIHAG